MSKAVINLRDGYRTTIVTGRHTWYADEPEDAGGADSAPTPTDILKGALGACIAITIKLYAERKKWPLEGVDVVIEMQRFNGADYAAYTGDELYVHEFRKQIVLHGPLTEEQKTRLLEIGGKCPVHRAIATPSFFVEELLEALPSE